METKSRKSCIQLVSFPTYIPITQSSKTVPECFYKLQIQQIKNKVSFLKGFDSKKPKNYLSPNVGRFTDFQVHPQATLFPKDPFWPQNFKGQLTIYHRRNNLVTSLFCRLCQSEVFLLANYFLSFLFKIFNSFKYQSLILLF